MGASASCRDQVPSSSDFMGDFEAIGELETDLKGGVDPILAYPG
jgi:hypothetical protein